MASLATAITPTRVRGGSTALVAAGGTGLKVQILSLHAQNAGTGQRELILYDGSTERARYLLYPGQHLFRQWSQSRPVIPLDQMTAATALNGGLDSTGDVIVQVEYRYAVTGDEGGS